jgi:hypothetical protein
MFLHKLTDLLRSMFSREASPCFRLSTTRPSLEELESRLTPSAPAPAYLVPPIDYYSYTDAIVQVTPNLFSGTVTETITATVTSAHHGSLPSSTVLFNLNNQSQSAQLNSNGQATVRFTLPIFALFTSQTLDIHYPGVEIGAVVPTRIFPSDFLAPLYMNFDNLLLPATLSFGHLTQQDLSPTVDKTTGLPTGFNSFNTAQGETEDFGIFSFHYTDPGIIDSVTVGSMTLPGIFAFALDVYGGIP